MNRRQGIVLTFILAGAVAHAEMPLAVLVDNFCLQPLPVEIEAQHKISHDIQFQAIHLESDIHRSELQNHPCVLTVSEDQRVLAFAQVAAGQQMVTGKVFADPRDSEQPGLSTIKHAAAARFFYHPIWGIREPVIAAVVDTGIQVDHPDLMSRLWHGASGEVGYNILTGQFDPSDDNGHGTHVAGILGAQRGNGIGIQGVMGDLVQIMSVKALDSNGGGNISDMVNGIIWAADHGAEVINLSLASLGANSAIQTAIEYALSKNIVVVASAGNAGAEINSTNFFVPAAYAPSYEGLISVGAVDAVTLARPSYSNFSNQYVEIAAPGSQGINGLLSTFINSSYIRDRGTSIAAPHVGAAAALVISFLKTHGYAVNNALVERYIEQGARTNNGLAQDFIDGRWLDLERLGRFLFNSTVIDASGGFDETP